jgi:hypothetical protein
MEEQARIEEEQRQAQKLRETKIAECLQRTREYIRDGMYEKALNEIETVYAMDPGNAEAQEYEQNILTIQRKAEEAQRVSEQRSQQVDAWKKEEEEKRRAAEAGREDLQRESSNTYRAMLKQAWAGGVPTKEDREMLDVVRLSLGVSEAEHRQTERMAQLDAYAEALRSAVKSGAIEIDDERAQEHLWTLFALTREDHLGILSTVRSEVENGY